jgi:hypothetical protein
MRVPNMGVARRCGLGYMLGATGACLTAYAACQGPERLPLCLQDVIPLVTGPSGIRPGY